MYLIETHYCWMVRADFFDVVKRLVIPRSDPMLYEDAADLLFDKADEAIAWRDEQINTYEEAEDENELAYIKSWVLCVRSVVPVAEVS